MADLTPMEQLLAFCDWERKNNPHPDGKPHVAEWAAAEIERLGLGNATIKRTLERMGSLQARVVELEAMVALLQREVQKC